MSNGAADVPLISKSQRDWERTIGFVKILNGSGVLQYVLLEGRKRILADSLVSVYLGDPRFGKKRKKALDQEQKSTDPARRVEHSNISRSTKIIGNS